MSDVKLIATNDGGEITLTNAGDVKTTNDLESAVYLSLFAEPTWINGTVDFGRRYDSRLPEVMRQTVSNATRLDVIQAAKDALAWITDNGIAESIEVDAVIVSARRIDMTVTISKPDGDVALSYGLNWAAQEGNE